MKPHLLYFGSDYEVGLTQALTEQILELQKEKSIELFCVSSEKEMETGLHQQLCEANVRVKIIERLDVHKDFLRLVNQIDDVIQSNHITHVNVHNNWQLALVSYLKYRHILPRRFKIIYTIHGYRHNSRLKSMLAIGIIGTALLLFSDRVISMSSYVSRRFWFVAYKTSVVFYMMNKPEFQKKENVIAGSPLMMVFPAQFRHGKRQELLIRAVRNYVIKTADRDVRLILPGDGELLGKMKNMVEDFGLSDIVVFPGKLTHSETMQLYGKCNIALVSSNVETYGRCIAEPFVLGRCLITQKTGVALDIVRHAENGFFFSDASSLVNILVELHANPEKVVTVGNQAFQERDRFSRDRVMEDYLKAIR